MSLVDRLRDSLGSTEPEEQNRYQCRQCYETFETEHALDGARCPKCSSTNLRAA